jgi:cbb3-type cytochrome oxidase subunit 3
LGKFAVQALTAALSGVLAAVIYYSLRAAKEGIDIDRIVSVFD